MPRGDSTMPNTWSAQVMNRNVRSMIQMPYFLRKRGTLRFTPVRRWNHSPTTGYGHTVHQKREKTK